MLTSKVTNIQSLATLHFTNIYLAMHLNDFVREVSTHLYYLVEKIYNPTEPVPTHKTLI